jgi:hypothetical protein
LTAVQLMDVEDLDALTERVRAWRAGGRPSPSLPSQFRTKNVVTAWQKLLGSAG